MSFDRSTTCKNEKLEQLRAKLKELLHLINTSLAIHDEAIKEVASYKYFLFLKQLEIHFVSKFAQLMELEAENSKEAQSKFEKDFSILNKEIEDALICANIGSTKCKNQNLEESRIKLIELLQLVNTSLASPDEAIKKDASYEYFLYLKKLEMHFVSKFAHLMELEAENSPEAQSTFDLNLLMLHEEIKAASIRAYLERGRLTSRMAAPASEPTLDLANKAPEKEISPTVLDRITEISKKSLAELISKYTTFLNNITAILLLLEAIKSEDLRKSIDGLVKLKKEAQKELEILQKNEDLSFEFIKEAEKTLERHKEIYARIKGKYQQIFFDQDDLDEYQIIFDKLDEYEKEIKLIIKCAALCPQEFDSIIVERLKGFSHEVFLSKQNDVTKAKELVTDLRKVDYGKLGDKYYLEAKNSCGKFKELNDITRSIRKFNKKCGKFINDPRLAAKMGKQTPAQTPEISAQKITPAQIPVQVAQASANEIMSPQISTQKAKTTKKPGFFATHWQTLIAANVTSILTGAAVGALTGTLIGGPIGAIVGLVVGGVTAIVTGAVIAYDGAKKDLAILEAEQQAKEKAAREQEAPASSPRPKITNILLDLDAPQITSPVSIPGTSTPGTPATSTPGTPATSTPSRSQIGSSPTLPQQSSYQSSSPTLFAKSYGQEKSALLASAAKRQGNSV